jgi:hypothetical protein
MGERGMRAGGRDSKQTDTFQKEERKETERQS